ncbi:MAG TPA: DUF2066 domain-containing protein [Aliidongia sp.]|nr:DUF2066 domain-containing protein [Aliidongia sp.]
MPERCFPGLRAAVRLAVLLIGLILAGAAPAATSFPQAFVVAGVPVDATAQNAVAAREAARIQGQRTAFRRLLERLTQSSDWPRLPSPGDDAVTNLVQDFDVANEHSSGVRYLAAYTFRFKASAVRALLRGAGIAESELASKPVILVPVLRTADGTKLWDNPNPWRDAWVATAGKGGIVPWIVPAGDAADAAFDPAGPTPDQISALARRYGDGDVVVATASAMGGDPAGLDINVSRYGPEGNATTATAQVSGRSDSSLYQAGVLAAQRELEEQWKKLSFAVSTSGGEPSEIEVSVPISGVRDWAAVEERLAKVPTIEHREVELMSRSEVRLRLKIKGDSNLLKLALAQQDLTLGNGSPYATLQLRSRAAE